MHCCLAHAAHARCCRRRAQESSAPAAPHAHLWLFVASRAQDHSVRRRCHTPPSFQALSRRASSLTPPPPPLFPAPPSPTRSPHPHHHQHTPATHPAVADRVAAERGESTGENVGYSIRLESRGGPSSSLMFCTNGVLLRMLTGVAREPLAHVTHLVRPLCPCGAAAAGRG